MNDTISVGVDAGGTSTTVAVSAMGTYESARTGGPSNASSIGLERSAATIGDTIAEALAGRVADAIHVGAAGAGRDSVAVALETALRKRFPLTRKIVVSDDARIALRTGIPEGPGIALIAGTGSVAYAENGATSARVGGAGYLLGDEGSAYAIGLAAMKLLFRVYDGRAQEDETTALAARALGVSGRGELLDAIYRSPLEPQKIAALAPSIIAFAGKGNKVSTRIVQTAATELGDLVRAAARGAGLSEASPSIAFAGGLLRENSLLTYLLELRVVNEIPGAAIVRVRDDAAMAALRLAEAAVRAQA